MRKILFSIFPFLLSSLTYAAKELDAPSAPAETVSMVYVVVFVVLFVGMIVGFFIYLWMQDKNKSEDKK